MKFRKNAVVAGAAKLAIIVSALVMIGFLFLLQIESARRDPAFITAFAVFEIGFAALIVVLALLRDENMRMVTISEEGVQMNSRFYGHQSIRWEECGLIGIYGYGYGCFGVLIFSKEKYIAHSEQECRRYAAKNVKKIISINYSPELFAAVKQYAPPHLISACRRMVKCKL